MRGKKTNWSIGGEVDIKKTKSSEKGGGFLQKEGDQNIFDSMESFGIKKQ